MFTMQAGAKLRPLLPILSRINPDVGVIRGRKYSISTAKSEEMLADALNQPTLEKQIQSLEFAVSAGADINQKINNVSALKRISNYEENFLPLAATLFKLGAKVDYTEYQEGSPLHNVLYYVGSTPKKIDAIWIYTKFGVNINHVNKELATPLDYAEYFSSNRKGKAEIILALRIRGAVHGFGFYSPDRSLPILSKPVSAIAIVMTGTVAVPKNMFKHIYFCFAL